MNRLPAILLVILSLPALLLLLAHCATPPAPDTAAWRATALDNDVTEPSTPPDLSATSGLTETIYLPLVFHDWPPFADWSVTGDLMGDLLGWTVATAGDVNGDGYADVIVGAPGYSNSETEEGAAFLYLGGREAPPPTGLDG